MYVARLVIEGKEVIVVLFVEHGVLKTAYAPSHPETEGPAGHTIEYIKYHIKQQQFMKVAENSDNPVVPEVPTGEVPPDPGSRPDPK